MTSQQTVPYLYDAHDLDQIVPLVQAAKNDARGVVARALIEHLVRHWSWFLAFADCQVALVENGQVAEPAREAAAGPRRGADRAAATTSGCTGCGAAAICPTTPRSAAAERDVAAVGGTRAPLRPGPAQLRRAPARARARRRPAAHTRSDSLAERLGVRGEPSPSTFTLEDARLLCRRLESGSPIRSARSTAAQLREVIKPVYRELFELLSGHSGDAGDAGALADAPLLADTHDGPALPARGARSSTPPRPACASAAESPGPCRRSSSRPSLPRRHRSTRLFGVRTLEDALEWHPEPGECPFDPAQMARGARGLRALVPPLLARIRVERTNADGHPRPRGVRRARRAGRLELSLTCTLDGVRLDRVAERPYFVDASPAASPSQAFVVWDESRTWPPPADAAQGLAMALADALGINLVETFLAFIQSDELQRRRLLDIAGASAMLAEVEHELADAGGETETPPEDDPDDEATSRSNPRARRRRRRRAGGASPNRAGAGRPSRPPRAVRGPDDRRRADRRGRRDAA